MTIITAHPTSARAAASHPQTDAPRVTWSEADAGLWVANADGVFGGSVDASSGAYLARDPFGRDRGTFPTRRAAQRCLEAFLAHPAMRQRLTASPRA